MAGEGISIIFSLLLYKLASLCVGAFLCYLGYRLYQSGVWGKAGDLNAKFGNNTLVLKSAAPGTFFALFGALVIGLTVWKGLQLESLQEGAQQLTRAGTTYGDSLPEKAPWEN